MECTAKRTWAETELFLPSGSCGLSHERDSERARNRKREKSVIVKEKGIVKAEPVFELYRENGDGNDEDCGGSNGKILVSNGETSCLKKAKVEVYLVSDFDDSNSETSTGINVEHVAVETGVDPPPPREVITEHVAPVMTGVDPPPREVIAEHIAAVMTGVDPPPREVIVEHVAAVMAGVDPPPREVIAGHVAAVMTGVDPPPREVIAEHVAAVMPSVDPLPREVIDGHVADVMTGADPPPREVIAEHVTAVMTGADPPPREVIAEHVTAVMTGVDPLPREVIAEHVAAVMTGVDPPPRELIAEHVAVETSVTPPPIERNVQHAAVETGDVPPAPQYYCTPTKDRSRRFPIRWSKIEEDAIRNGVQRFGKGNWMLILKTYHQTFQARRTSMDLKDKWRNLMIKDEKKIPGPNQ